MERTGPFRPFRDRGGFRWLIPRGGPLSSVTGFDRRATLDIDAVYHPGDLVERAAGEIAGARGLPADWLNNHSLGFVPFAGEEEWTELFTDGPIAVFVASAPMLLAMKLAANRGLGDSADIEGLLHACGVTSVEQAQTIDEQYRAQGVLTHSAEARVRALLDTYYATSRRSEAPW